MVDRGRVITILMEPQLFESESLQKMNKNKVGRRFRFCAGLISAAFAVKCVFRLAYRQLEGFMKDISDKLHKRIPNFRTIWWRIDRMKSEGVKFDTCERHQVIAIDSSGLRPINDGEYRMMKYGKMREWIKIHFAIDIRTKEILNLVVTKGNVGDCREFKSLVEPLTQTSEVLADGAYCSTEIYEFCDKRNITPTIPVKLNFSNTYITSKTRRKMLEEQLGLNCKRGSTRLNRFLSKECREQNQERWKKEVGYGRRVLVESAFSRYKRVVGETLFSKKFGNIEKEIVAKSNVLNKFATM